MIPSAFVFLVVLLIALAVTACTALLKLQKTHRRLKTALLRVDEIAGEYNAMISEVTTMFQENQAFERIQRDLETARVVQETLMPVASSSYGSIQVSGRLFMANKCGGDWWYHARSGDWMMVWVGDVTGHNMDSALIASACRAAIGSFEHFGIHSPGDALTMLNKILHPMTHKEEVLATVAVVSVNPKTGEVLYANASHPSVQCIRAAGDIEDLQADLRSPVGLFKDTAYPTHKSELAPGDALFVMTDGLLDIEVGPGVRWSGKVLDRGLRTWVGETAGAEGVTERLEAKIQSLTGKRLIDDVTFVVIRNCLADS